MDIIVSAKNSVAIAAEALQVHPITMGTTYLLSPTIYHPNINMEFVATGRGFKTGEPYVRHRFTNGDPLAFNAMVIGFELTQFYLFAMLPLASLPPSAPGVNRIQVGPDDGERNTGIVGNSAAVLEYNFTSDRSNTNSLSRPVNTIRLPGHSAEFVDGFYHSIQPTASDKQWVNFSLERGDIQKNTVIQLIAGFSGNENLGMIGTDHQVGSYDMSSLSSYAPNNNINAVAMIHPEIVNGEYVFQLGDPEKDGKIKLTTV